MPRRTGAKVIVWTALALKDLEEIRDYIRRDNPKAARQEAQGIRKGTERLARFPKSGRALATISGIREIIRGNYHVFYRLHKNQIEILRVYHGRRLTNNLPPRPYNA